MPWRVAEFHLIKAADPASGVFGETTIERIATTINGIAPVPSPYSLMPLDLFFVLTTI
jgi:hypothetical protein